MYDDELYDEFNEIPLINDLATGSDAFMPGDGYTSDGVVLETVVGVATPANLDTIHSDIQSLHWSILCIYVICMFCWICKQWG